MRIKFYLSILLILAVVSPSYHRVAGQSDIPARTMDAGGVVGTVTGVTIITGGLTIGGLILGGFAISPFLVIGGLGLGYIESAAIIRQCAVSCPSDSWYGERSREISRSDIFKKIDPFKPFGGARGIPDLEPGGKIIVQDPKELILDLEERKELRDAPDSKNKKPLLSQIDQLRKDTEEAIKQLRLDEERRKKILKKPVSPDITDPEIKSKIKDTLEESDPKKSAYEDALKKANSIADGISAQVISQTGPEARVVTDAASPKIAQMMARLFSTGDFYVHDIGTLKTVIYNIIKAEVDSLIPESNRQIGYSIADQIATQMATQFMENPDLSSVSLALTVEKPKKITDQEVLDVINQLKYLQQDGGNKDFVIWKGIAAGQWVGETEFSSSVCGLSRSDDWVGSWIEGDQVNVHTSIKGERKYLSLLGSFAGIGLNSVMEGLHYSGTAEVMLFAKSKTGHDYVFEGEISSLNENIFDKKMGGKVRVVCPDGVTAVEGVFSGKRYKSDITGAWSGSFDINEPSACVTKSDWQLRMTEVKRNDSDSSYRDRDGDVTGVLKIDGLDYEVRGTYDPGNKELIMIAGDYAFLGNVSTGKISGSMLGKDCEKDGEYPNGRHRRGTFEATFIDR